jgi:hypothetical protein
MRVPLKLPKSYLIHMPPESPGPKIPGIECLNPITQGARSEGSARSGYIKADIFRTLSRTGNDFAKIASNPTAPVYSEDRIVQQHFDHPVIS